MHIRLTGNSISVGSDNDTAECTGDVGVTVHVPNRISVVAIERVRSYTGTFPKAQPILNFGRYFMHCGSLIFCAVPDLVHPVTLCNRQRPRTFPFEFIRLSRSKAEIR